MSNLWRDEFLACEPASVDEWYATREEWIPRKLGELPAVVQNASLRIDRQFREIEQLEDDWDDDSAPAISVVVIARARALIDDLRIRCRNRGSELPVPQISACPNGTIDFYWTFGARKVLASITAGGLADFAIRTDDGLRLSGTARHIMTLVDWLLR